MTSQINLEFHNASCKHAKEGASSGNDFSQRTLRTKIQVRILATESQNLMLNMIHGAGNSLL